MTSRSGLTLLALLVFSACASSGAHAGPFEGEWIGGYQEKDEWVFVKVVLGGEGSAPTGRIDFPMVGIRALLLRNVRFEGAAVVFELHRAPDSDVDDLVFHGRHDNGRIKGHVRQRWKWTGFELIKMIRLPDSIIQSTVGNYELGPGRTLLVYVSPQGLAYVDYATGRLGHLFAIAPDTFVSGPTVTSGYPVELTVRVERAEDGRVTGLTWTPAGRATQRAARRTYYRTEDVTFASGGVRISASLLMPAGPGPFPAVVMIHGSGPTDRASLMPVADALARNGVAVVAPDKRGAGRSTGDWVRATFDDLADDALAAVAFLKQRAGIDPHRIGLQGASLGGWVAPLAASRSSDVRFVIVEAAPTISPAEHERRRVERQMLADGVRREIVSRALAFMDRKFEVGRTGEGWDALVRDVERARREGWVDYVNPPASLENMQWHWRHVLSYDPQPALERLTCPVLAVYAELDTVVPADFSRARIVKALDRAGNTDVTVKVLPRANHGFFAAVSGGPSEVPRLRGFVDGYFDARVDWLLERIDGAPTVTADAAIGRSTAPGPARGGPAEIPPPPGPFQVVQH
jgi:dienelactone hydrolase